MRRGRDENRGGVILLNIRFSSLRGVTEGHECRGAVTLFQCIILCSFSIKLLLYNLLNIFYILSDT